ncbi:MAG: ATP-binding cassette domain-containing protein, partial [Rhodococcus sp. (in: high G+C Gram-positive bacteria)]
MMLEIDNLHAGYRRLEILHGLDMSIAKNEIVSLIGANGAGKTTTLQALSGLVSPTGGRIVLDGVPIHGMRAD